MSAENETHAAVIDEMHGFKCRNLATGELEECTCISKYLADRAEAAHKREVEKLNSVIQATVSCSDAEIDRLRREVAELRKQIGNAAKLREALRKIRRVMSSFGQDLPKKFHAIAGDAIFDADQALVAPARNCDVISNRDDAVRIFQAAFVEAAASHLHLTNAAYVKLIEPLGELFEIAIEALYSTYHAEDSAAQNNESEVSK